MQDLTFYQSHLDRVSRSFAFCIQKLESPMRAWTSLSYLLCRVLDTVEDSQWNDSSLRTHQYSQFESFLLEQPQKELVQKWISDFPNTIPTSEKQLIEDAYLLFTDLHQLPNQAKSVIQSSVIRMSIGMTYYSSRETQACSLRLTDLKDVNRYCYFVAGVVGELLTQLILACHPDFDPQPDLLKNAFHFGLFLQKINLLKDQLTDETENRFLVPNRTLLIKSLKENITGSIAYITSLPINEKGYRTFCAWSLFLGAASLPWIQKSFSSKDGSKIPRSETEKLLASIEEIAQDNDELQKCLSEYLPYLSEFSDLDSPDSEDSGDSSSQEKSKNQSDPQDEWFIPISGNILNPFELRELKLI